MNDESDAVYGIKLTVDRSEYEPRSVILACRGCAGIWTLRVPRNTHELISVVKSNGCCITCGNSQVVKLM